MSVKNASGFSQGEILLAKKVDNTGFQTEYILLQSASVDGDNSNEDETHGRIYVQRAYGSGTQGDFVGDLASAAQSYEDGQVIVSTGKLNTGYIKMNANPNDVNTPYMDVVERTGSGLYDVALKVRLGDLSGLANSDYVFGNSNPGFGLATDNVFLQGGIIAKTGSIGGISMADGKLFTGIYGAYNNSNTGFYVDSGSQFSLGDKLSWNPSTSTLSITGQLNFADGTSVETAIDNVSSGSIARTVELSADKYVVTFDEFGNEAPSNQTITLTATPQNFIGQVYYEYYKDSTIQGARGTANTFTVDTTLEKPTSSTPKTYEVRAFTGSDGGTAASTDSLTLFGLQPGSDGAPGVDSVTAFLTNESHTLPLSSSGAIQSYAGADTQMKVFEGITDKTSNYSFTESSAAYITATSSSNTFTITNTTSPYSGSVTITAVSESVSLSKIMSIGITRQGDDGSDGTPGVSGDNAKTLIGSVDSQIFAFDDSTDNSATPGTINFSFSQQNLNDVIVSSDITITTADSNNVTNFSFNNNSVGGDTNQKSGIVSGSVSYTGGFSSGGLNGAKTSLPLTISCTNDTLTDSVTVFKVEGGSDGAGGVDAVTTFLTNESHTLPSQNDGTVVSFVGAVTDMEVFEGTTNKNSTYTFSKDSTTSVSSSISGNTITITSMAHDSGSVIITAVSESVSLSKTMTLSKSKQGTAGLPGADAKLLSLSSDSQVFSFPSASSNTPIDNDVLIIVNQQNLSGTIGAGDITIKDSGGSTLVDPTFVANVTDGTGQVSGSITFNTTLSSTKSKLPITIEVSKDGLEDSLKIFKVDGGGDGVDGTDAVIAFLTNESHTFAADSSGAIAVYTGGSTDMEVFEGITNVTSNYVISSSNGAGVSASDSGNTVTISTMTADSANVNINASSGSVSIDKIMSLVKSKQGPDGDDGTSAKLLIGSLDSQVMAFDDVIDTDATPSSIEFSFQQQNLAAPISASDVTIQMNGGGNITNFTFVNTDAVSGTGIVSGSVSFAGNTNAGGMGSDKSKFPLTISATKDSLQDAVKIFKVEGGSDGTSGVSAITALLTNDSHTLPVTSSIGVISYAGASTDILVFQGTSDVTNDYIINTGSISSHITTTTSGDTVTITESTTPFSGSVEITATSGSVVLTKLMSISQALQGDDGSDGTPGENAKTITLSADTQTFAFDDSTDTSATPTSAVFSINQQNLSGAIAGTDITITTSVSSTINTPTVSGTVTNGTGTRTFTLPFSSLTKSDLPLTVSVTKDSVTDTTSIIKVEGGANGVSALQYLLTNEAHIVPASSTGVVSSYTNSGTEIYVYEGSTELVYDAIGTSNGTWKINTPTVSPTGDITVGGAAGIIDGGNYAVVGNHNGMDNNTDSVTISYPISGKTADGTAFSFTKTQTIAKSKEGSDGLPGTSASLISLTGDSQVFAFASASATTPDDTTIELFITQQNLGKTLTAADITIIDAIGGSHTVPTFAPTSLSNNSGVISGSLVFNTNSPSPKGKYPITITATSGSLSDSFKVFALDGGADGTSGIDAITFIVSNESHTLAADANGSVSSYAGAETDVTIFEGVTDKTNTYFINGAGSADVTIDNDFNSFNSSSLNITDMGVDSGSVTITAISGGIHHSGWGSRAGENWATGQFSTNNPNGDINGTDNDWYYEDNPDTTIVGTGDGELYNNYVEFGNNANNDRVWIIGKDIVAYDDTKTYYVEARFKRVAGSGTVYIGANGWSSESYKRNKTGGNSFGSQHYIAANGFTFSENEGTDWVTKRGYFTGHSTNGNSNTGEAPDINTPKSINTAATYISPMFLAGYGSTAGKVRVDYIVIKEVKDGSGNLSTGVVKIDKTMSLVKSRAGTDGTPGAAGSGSKTVSLTAATNVVTYDADGLNPSPSSTIALSANSQNFTDGHFAFTGDGITEDTAYTNGTSANGDSKDFTVPSSYFSTPKTIRVGVSEAADSTTELTFDTVTIVAVQPGAAGAGGVDAVTAFLTSEADVVPAANNGDVSSFNGSGTEMFIYEGVTNVSSNYTVTNNNSTGLTATISNRVLTITALTPDSGSVILTAASGGVSISKTYSIAKSKAGAQGDQGANNQDFSYLDTSLTGIGPISSPGLLMNSDVFGFHNGISGTNGSLSDFTSFLDDSGNFYLGGNSSGMSGSAATSGYLAWNNTDRSLLISGSNANIEVDKFFLGTGTSQYISGSNGNVEIAGDVTFRGRPDNGDGNVVFFDDFSQYPNVAATSGGDAPKFDGTGQGWWYNKGVSTTNSPLLVTDTDCISGKSLVIGNNAGDDEANLHSNQLIPFNESSLYEVEVRIKRTAGASATLAYVGISGMQSDGTTKVDYAGGSGASGHYITLSANNLGNGSGTGYFQTFKGYFKGATRTTSSGDTTMHDDKTNPATLRTEINGGFIRAYLLLNYNDTQGITHVDYIKIKEFTSGGTSRISGDSITTGIIKSNNLSHYLGTSLALDDGIFKIGGTGAYTTQNGILMEGAAARIAIGKSDGNYMRFNHTAGKLEINTPNFTIDDSGNVAVSGNITVSNPEDNSAGTSTYYNFGGNGSQVIDTAVFDLNGNLAQHPTTTGIGTADTSDDNIWDSSFRMKQIFYRTEQPFMEWDFKVTSISSNNHAEMFGWFPTNASTTSTAPLYAVYINANDLYWRYGGSNSAVVYNIFEIGDTWRLRIRIKSGGGATGELFKNGDFTTPAHTYDFTNSTYNSVIAGNIIYDGGTPCVEHQAISIGAPLSVGTVISGNGISTGNIQSTNWGASAGTQLSLDDGIATFGGSSNQRIEIDGANADLKFYDSSGNQVIELNDDLVTTPSGIANHPGMNMTNGTLRVIETSDFGNSSDSAPLYIEQNYATLNTNRTAGFFGIGNANNANTNWDNNGINGKNACGSAVSNYKYQCGVFAEANLSVCPATPQITAGIVSKMTGGDGYSFYGIEGVLFNTNEIQSDSDIIAYNSSDARMKDNVEVIDNPIEKIKQIRGVSFNWNEKGPNYTKGWSGQPNGQKRDIGVIAQEVQKVLPEVVHERSKDSGMEGMLGVKYDKIVPLLIEGIKEQQTMIENLQARIKKLEGE